MVELLALAAALSYAIGAVLQHHASSEVARQGGHPHADRLLARLAARPGWYAGILLNAVGWGLQAAALGMGQLVVVQPLLVTSVVFTLPVEAIARRARVGAREWGGTMAVAAGLAGFLLAARPMPGTAPPSGTDWALALAGSLGFAGVCVALGRRGFGATWLGVAAGALFGLAAALTKATVDSFTAGTLLTTWPLYGMLGVTALAFYLMQLAFHSGPLVASFPALIAMDPIASCALGLTVFGETMQASAAGVGVAGACFALVIAGVVVLSKSELMPA